MSSRTLAVALAFVLLGLGASAAATWVHYQLVITPGYVSACDVNATFSCTEAYQSSYGRLLGIPVAVLGMTYFLGLLALMVLGRSLDALAGYLFAAAAAGLPLVVYLAWATLFVLGTICVLCLLTYVAVLGLFFVAGASTPFPMADLPGRFTRDVRRLSSSPVALVALLLVAGTTVGAAALFPPEPDAVAASPPSSQAAAGSARPPVAAPPLTEAQKEQLRTTFDAAPRAIVPADAAGASVVIVKFNDYQCPPCRQTYEMYKPIKAKYERIAPGKVRFLTRDFPLEPECNPSAPGGSHTAACEAAVAVRLAREQGKADEMEDWLFANQPALTPDLVRQGARTVGGVTDFDARYPEVLNLVRADATLGGSLGVNSTPTFFINGVKTGGVQPQVLDYLIEYELSKAAPAGR
jgi:protein-disulfide isomerase/uncharacterized membrane protein